MYKWVVSSDHAWLVVPLHHVIEAGFLPSQFSFFDESNAYLEEDCDAPAFLSVTTYATINDADAFPERVGHPPTLRRFRETLVEHPNYRDHKIEPLVPGW